MEKLKIGDEVCSVIVPTMIGTVIDISKHGLLKVQIKTTDGTHMILVDEAYWRKVKQPSTYKLYIFKEDITYGNGKS